MSNVRLDRRAHPLGAIRYAILAVALVGLGGCSLVYSGGYHDVDAAARDGGVDASDGSTELDAAPDAGDAARPDGGDAALPDSSIDSGSMDSGAPDAGPPEMTCNGMDDDGDGQVDEGLLAGGAIMGTQPFFLPNDPRGLRTATDPNGRKVAVVLPESGGLSFALLQLPERFGDPTSYRVVSTDVTGAVASSDYDVCYDGSHFAVVYQSATGIMLLELDAGFTGTPLALIGDTMPALLRCSSLPGDGVAIMARVSGAASSQVILRTNITHGSTGLVPTAGRMVATVSPPNEVTQIAAETVDSQLMFLWTEADPSSAPPSSTLHMARLPLDDGAGTVEASGRVIPGAIHSLDAAFLPAAGGGGEVQAGLVATNDAGGTERVVVPIDVPASAGAFFMFRPSPPRAPISDLPISVVAGGEGMFGLLSAALDSGPSSDVFRTIPGEPAPAPGATLRLDASAGGELMLPRVLVGRPMHPTLPYILLGERFISGQPNPALGVRLVGCP